MYTHDYKTAQSLFKPISEQLEFTKLIPGVSSLGLVIQGVEGAYNVTMNAYVEKMISSFGMQDANIAYTPLDSGFTFKEAKQEQIEAAKDLPYRQLLGSLLYAQQCMYPELSFAMSILAHYQSEKWGRMHWNALKRSLRFLKGVKSKPLSIQACHTSKSILIDIITDASFGSPFDGSEKSRSGCLVYVNHALVWWCSKNQTTTAVSSTEAELYAMKEGIKEGAFLYSLLSEITNHRRSIEVTIYSDSQSAIKSVKSGALTDRNKHYRATLGFLKDFVHDTKAKLHYVPTELMLADSLTKNTPRPVFEKHVYFMHHYDEWLEKVQVYAPSNGEKVSKHTMGGAEGDTSPKRSRTDEQEK